ncbi:Slam-dependent surface lipoprotein [Brenneria tiliae]|uniref:Slam-dependent surface lipoprotein n=1 Tax=Brenneria tiliae TaxID=2914984 RepID=UPI002014CA76|nr:Slam-dependent surface lipoprotein [Brenneria tiliae]MCL2898745.1 hypothetical protein [Brenneria tiliae]MCL2903318.1 hypothetical protein [Brenneria tiliae]
MNIVLRKTLLALAIAGTAGAAQADIVSGQSYTETDGIRLGAATFQNPGVAGAGVDGQLLNQLAPATHFALADYQDSTGVYTWSGREIVADGAAPGPDTPIDHSGIGVWSFAQVGSQDVWFGEWDAEAAEGDGAIGDKVAGTHTAWYVGESGDVATTLPTGAPVTYTVQSINNYTGATLPTSTLTANFDGLTASSTGDISFSGGAITNTGSDVQLAANGVNVASSGGTNGDLAGNFFGTGAAAVAGIVTFADRNQDTAFGGSKNP